MTDPVRPRRGVAVLLVFAALSVATLAAGGWLTTAGRADDWYATLRKPPFQPPDWVFGPAWTTLMGLTALAAWRIHQSQPVPARRRTVALGLYGVQLLLNVGWSALFFNSRRPAAALAEILAFVVAMGALVIAYARVDRIAAALMVPYLLWLVFAAALNAWIVANN